MYRVSHTLTLHFADRQRLEDHEELFTFECKGVEGSQGMRAGMRLRIHFLHRALARISSLHPYLPDLSIPTGIACILPSALLEAMDSRVVWCGCETVLPRQTTLTRSDLRSCRKMPEREAQDYQRRGYPHLDACTGVRQLRGRAQDLPRKVSRGEWGVCVTISLAAKRRCTGGLGLESKSNQLAVSRLTRVRFASASNVAGETEAVRR